MKLFLLACLALSPSCQSSPSEGVVDDLMRRAGKEADVIRIMLDDWHQAASVADGARYLGHMTADAVYLGTDASERWTLEEFRSFCEPYFQRGVGWTYEPRVRHVSVQGNVAWFDEQLWNDKYGLCRGTGVLRREAEQWRIAHYSLTFLVPNETAAEVVEVIGAERGK